MSKFIRLLILLTVFFVGSALFVPLFASQNSEGITIVYTNDIHSYIDNQTNEVPDLRFSKISALMKDLRAEGKNVCLVDAGDEIQGSIYGSIDNGRTVVSLMSAAGYQVSTIGNHDFDFGVDNFLDVAEQKSYKTVCCNFLKIADNSLPFPPYTIEKIGDKSVAFIGVLTPSTIVTSTPTFFYDENGNPLYSIIGSENPVDMYVTVQTIVDEIRDSVDYVILISHLGFGVDYDLHGISSKCLIKNTTGIDAVIDGHSHSIVEQEFIKNKDGNDVLLTQAGYYLNAVGIMNITSEGKFSSGLIYSYENSDSAVADMENQVIQNVESQLGVKVAYLENTLYTNNSDNPDQRIIRAQETNLGDFVPDSIYWYFNEVKGINCDIALSNAGGIRTQIEKGSLSYKSSKNVQPFGNVCCAIKVKGQDILDALEMGASSVGLWDYNWNAPAENSGFMQVAGMKYTINSSVKSSVQVTPSGMFDGVNGPYRVCNVMIYNKKTGQYENLDLERTYCICGINYILRNDGNGLTMLGDGELFVDYVAQDADIMNDYCKSFSKENGYPSVCTKNSPLKKYSGYLIDYENPLGSGRITII